jgi:enamine deaminase RidA (YjgF/YER057c/UK114 family)
MNIERIRPGNRYSHAVKAAGLVYTLGQVAIDAPGTDASTQTKNILHHLDQILSEAGTDKSMLVSATVYLTDLGDYGSVNEVWDNWVVPGCAPARAVVKAELVGDGYAVEIAVVALVN